jgi:hypothetical protein
MKLNDSDKIRVSYNGFMEPCLLTACKHQGSKLKISRSKYIRYAVIKKLIEDGYPLNHISNKFNMFYQVV